MLRAYLKNQKIELVEEDLPEIGPMQILVRTKGCGVCEGDLFLYKASAGSHDAISFGHEASGIVEEVGSWVTQFKKGDRVSSMNGGYGEFFISDDVNLVHVPESLNLETALGEPLSCCVHGAEKFNIRLGDNVAVFGCGYMGLVSLQLALLRGASQITAFDPIPWRREQALAFGADRAMDPGEANFDELSGFDVVIEATGVAQAIQQGTKLLKHHGTLNLVGYHQSENGIRSIDMKEWNYKALNIINGHIRDLDMKKEAMEIALKLSAAGKIDTGVLVTNYPLSQINQAFSDLAARKQGLYKANIVF